MSEAEFERSMSDSEWGAMAPERSAACSGLWP